MTAERENASLAAALDNQDPMTILAPVVKRDDADLSATETREQELADADHLGTLHAIWMDQCRAEAHARYTQAVRAHADPADAEQILKDTDRLWRTVSSAESAGLDGAQVIRPAIEARPFTGARSHSAVLDARIRKNTGYLPPRIRESWSASLPSFADPEVTRYMTDLAAAMDDRRQRLGEHTAQEPRCGPPLGRHQVPSDDRHVAATVTGNTVVLAGHVRTRAQRDAVAGGHGWGTVCHGRRRRN